MNELDFLYKVKGLSEFSSPPTLRSWVSENKERFISKLEETGAILFSDLPVKDAKEFDHFVSMFNLKAFTYKQSLSNAVRINKTDKVFTANEAPKEVEIFLHHELAQTPFYPKYIFFPHWSKKVDTKIVNNYECVCFHETDLPYGRGGSPIQNLILRNQKMIKHLIKLMFQTL